MKDLIIIGAGGFGREVLEFALDIQEQTKTDWKVKGFITDIIGDFYEKDTLGYNILDDITHHKILPNCYYVFAIADIPFKIKTTQHFLENGANFINLIHPSTIVGRTVKMGIGNVISPKVSINSNTVIGNFIRIGTGTSIGHDSQIEDYATINSSCIISGYSRIDQGAFLGSGSIICPHAKIEQFSTVGAGAVVLKKVKSNTTVFGNPSKKLDY